MNADGLRRSAVAAALCMAALGTMPTRAQDLPPAAPQAAPLPMDGALSGERLLAASGIGGGLAVHAGCGDGALMVSLARNPTLLVHGLVRDPARVAAVRREIQSAGLYGAASALAWDGAALPYADGTVNLLVVSAAAADVPLSEVDRVLAPMGMAWLEQDRRLMPRRQPWPTGIDEWSHTRYDATGNAVSRDERVGPPQALQWEALPRWNRSVKTSALVSARGRIFYILDDSHFASSERTWALVARDAFNGIQLWRHELSSWGGSRGGKKVGPAQVNRLLVARENRVYAALGEAAPVSVLDAATGAVLRVLDPTAPAEEFLVSAGTLVALANPNTEADRRRGASHPMRLVAVAPEIGALRWERPVDTVLPLTLAADGTQVVYHDGTAIVSLDLATGAPRWTSPPTGQAVVHRDQANPDSPGAEASTIILAPQFAPTLIIYQDVVAFAGGRRLNVVSAADGSELWRSDYAPSNYSVPVDLFGFAGALWGPDPGMNLWRPLDDNLDFNAFDPRTGAVKQRVEGNYDFRFQHHRCHQMKVVGSTVLAARAGIEFLDTVSGKAMAHHWVRGSCYYGVMPANGLLYVPPHDCACYVRAKLSGLMAFRPKDSLRPLPIPDDRRLVPGPAHGQTADAASGIAAEDWPTYRHDMARSGRAATTVGTDLLLGWQTPVGGRLTSPVVAGNRLFVASTDSHALLALDADTGEVLWQHVFDSRVDAPPTVHEGVVLCGCRDGSVTALRSTDGALAWRFRAAPEERLIVSRGQLESPWPVHGNILVVNNVAYAAAGKSSYLDGGIHLYGLDPHSGRVLLRKTLWSRQEDGTQHLDEQGVDGYLNDILSSDGERLFMRHQVLDLSGAARPERVTHLHSPDGYLSSESTTRLLWTYAPLFTSPHQGAFYDQRVSRVLFPSGRILVEDRDVILGYGQNHYAAAKADPGGQWALFAAAKESAVPKDLSAVDYRKLAIAAESTVRYHWWKQIPVQAWAMVRTEDALFVAGPSGSAVASPAALAGKEEAALLAVSPADGTLLAEMPLPSMPVWDGMAAARGNLYLALADGRVLCLWSAASGRPGTALAKSAPRVELPPLAVAEEPGLVGRWRFDEGAGRLARDSSGRGHDAAVSSRWATGSFGTCLVAAGTPQAAVIPDAAHLHFGNADFALALWVSVEGHGVRLLGKEAFPENWWVINLRDDGRCELVLGEGRGAGQTVRAVTVAPMATGVWTHLAAVADRQAREVRWYVNGVLDSRHAIPDAMTKGLHGGGSDICIPSNHKPFRGLIGDLRIYRRAIGADRAKDLFDEESARRNSTVFRLVD